MTSAIDAGLIAADSALRTLFAPHRARRPLPQTASSASAASPADSTANSTADAGPGDQVLSEAERRLSGALMRVNHVGEICAQALYTSQALAARLGPGGSGAARERLARHLEAAGDEETDHLAWCEQRLEALGDRPSWLNPLWYAGAFGLGLLAGRLGDRLSLGFVVETERQVEAHLDSHLDRLPAQDLASRAIVEQMKADEARHAKDALQAGAAPLPPPVAQAMQLAARVMTTVAHRL